MKNRNLLSYLVLAIMSIVFGYGCENNQQDRSSWPTKAQSGKSYQGELRPGSADFAPISACEAAAGYSSHHYEGMISNVIGTHPKGGSIISYIELKGEKDSLWFSVSGGVYDGMGETMSVAMHVRFGDTVIFLGDTTKINSFTEVPSPAIDEIAKRHKDGSIELVYGVLRPEDEEAFMKLVDDDDYVYDGNCDIELIR